jgi:hypothetical protein
MRAPDEPFVDFSAEQWEDIRRAGRHAGIDVDTAPVREGEHTGTLRQRLKFIAIVAPASGEFMMDLPTPVDVANYLKQKRTEARAFLTSVVRTPLLTYSASEDFLNHVPEWERFLTSEESTIPEQERREISDLLLWALMRYEKALETEHARFAKLGSRSSKNPSKPTAKRSWYLTGVLSAWRNIGGDRAKRKVTLEFLFACTVPVFKDTTETMVRNWFDRHEPSPRSPD